MNYQVKVSSGLNVRSGPGSDYEVLDLLKDGQVITGLDDPGWMPYIYKEDAEGVTFGWVATKYLVKVEAPQPTPGGVVTGAAVVKRAMSQSGDPYIYGTEVDLDDPNPAAFDCSELVQWVCHQLGIKPEMPDGSAAQRAFCEAHGTMIGIEDAVKTAGALLFGDGHVAISRGDGTTIEARGKAYGVGSWSSKNRPWVAAAKIPALL